jgi:hypothetical protein
VADEQDVQRDKLLQSTARLDASSRRLDNCRRIAQETEDMGVGIVSDLKKQREQIERTRSQLDKSDSYLEKSMKTLKEMSRRYIIPPFLFRSSLGGSKVWDLVCGIDRLTNIYILIPGSRQGWRQCRPAR